MLRWTALLLALCNLGFLAWGQGWLLPYGWGPQTQREPGRLAQQIKPEAITLLDEAQLQALLAAERPVAAPACLQSGWLETAQADRVRAVLADRWPQGSWLLDSQDRPARWMLYMGRYANAAELARKREQLARLNVRSEVLRSDTLAPGLSLGSFATQAQADAALQKLAARGVRTARVLQAQPAGVQYRLRLPAVDASLQQRLAPLQAQLPALAPCAAETP